VKEERYLSGATRYPPLLSPLLVKSTLRGMRLMVTGFTGPYTMPEDIESRTDHIVHLCAGSGSVPNVSILKHALRHHPKLLHTLIYANKTWDDVIFRRDLETLVAQNPDRLRVVHALTRETLEGAREADVRSGRVSLALLQELVPDPSGCVVYACGPAISQWDRMAAKEAGRTPTPRFMETVLELLRELGVPADRKQRESYG